MKTTSLFKVIHSEMMNNGYNEFEDKDGNLIFFDSDKQVLGKILSYDDDIADIVDDLFSGLSLNQEDHDIHFKKAFIYRFLNRQINRQTIEAFKSELMYCFMTSSDYLNRIYSDMERFLSQEATSDQNNLQTGIQKNKSDSKQKNTQQSEGENSGQSTNDNRSAHAELPQNNVQIDVDNTVMDSASTNDIDRSKNKNSQNSRDKTEGQTDTNTTGQTDSETKGKTDGVTRSYQLNELFKTNGLLEDVLDRFDKKCFLQFW